MIVLMLTYMLTCTSVSIPDYHYMLAIVLCINFVLRGHDTIDFFEKKLNLKFCINVKL